MSAFEEEILIVSDPFIRFVPADESLLFSSFELFFDEDDVDSHNLGHLVSCEARLLVKNL